MPFRSIHIQIMMIMMTAKFAINIKNNVKQIIFKFTVNTVLRTRFIHYPLFEDIHLPIKDNI
jgi:hypothetical protein